MIGETNHNLWTYKGGPSSSECGNSGITVWAEMQCFTQQLLPTNHGISLLGYPWTGMKCAFSYILLAISNFLWLELLKAYGKQTRSGYLFKANLMAGSWEDHETHWSHYTQTVEGLYWAAGHKLLGKTLDKHIHLEVKCRVNCTPTNLFSQNFDFVYIQNLIWSADYVLV